MTNNEKAYVSYEILFRRNNNILLKSQREKGTESLFKEIMDENFLNMGESWASKLMKLIISPDFN